MKLSILFQRLEATALLIAMILTYSHRHYSWTAFILLILIIDISTAGYLINKRVGAITYNLGHSLIGPLALTGLVVTIWPAAEAFSIIWLAHIALDRSLGYGLKNLDGFHDTHLGTLGRHRKRKT